jgi:hypothetical protein
MIGCVIFSLAVRVQEGAVSRGAGAAALGLRAAAPRRLATAALAALLACSALASCRSPGATPADAGAAPAAEADAGRPRVQITWRLFETQRWIEGSARRESAVIEVLVNGGAPSRVDLGRRDTAGCAVGRPAVDDVSGAVTTLDCAAAEAQVLRSGPGELRITAGDDAKGDPTRAHEAAAVVRVPPDAEITVDRELGRVPDEAPGP